MEAVDPVTGEVHKGPNLMHIICCDPTVAFCGERLEDIEEGYIQGTEDCLSCRYEEIRRERLRLGCDSPLCPHRPLRQRLRYLLRRLLWPRNRWEWAGWLVIALSLLYLLLW